MTAQEGWTEGPGLLASAWRYKVWIVISAVVAGIVGYVWSTGQDPEYSASAELFLVDERDQGQFGTIPRRDFQSFIGQQATVIESRTVLDEAADTLGVLASDLAVEVTGDVERGILTIIAYADDAAEAAEVANATADAYRQFAAADIKQNADKTIVQLQQRVDLSTQLIDAMIEADETDTVDYREEVLDRIDLRRQIDNLRQDAELFGDGVELFTAASTPSSPDSPKPKRDAAMFALLAMGLATAVAYGRAGQPASHLLNGGDAERILNAPLLGTLPVYQHPDGDETLAQRLTIDAVSQESYHFLLSSILHELDQLGGRRLLVTSANPGDGKTEVSIQLAGAAVLEGKEPLLIDGDLRVQQLSNLGGILGLPGLVDTADRMDGAHDDLIRRLPIYTRGLEVRVISAGSPTDTGAGSIRLPGVVRFFDRSQVDHDLVIVDSAPILATADTTVLSSYTDAIVVVVRKGLSIKILKQVKEKLKFVNCEVLGYVFVSPDRSDHGGLDAYGYGPYGKSAYPMAAVVEPAKSRLRDSIGMSKGGRFTPTRPTPSPGPSLPTEPAAEPDVPARLDATTVDEVEASTPERLDLPADAPPAVIEASPEPVAEDSPEPVAEDSPEPVAEASPDPVAEDSPDPVVEESPELVAEDSPELVAEDSPDPVTEASPERVAEDSPEPVTEASPEPVAEETPEPAAEDSPDPVAEDSPAVILAVAEPSGDVSESSPEADDEGPVLHIMDVEASPPTASAPEEARGDQEPQPFVVETSAAEPSEATPSDVAATAAPSPADETDDSDDSDESDESDEIGARLLRLVEAAQHARQSTSAHMTSGTRAVAERLGQADGQPDTATEPGQAEPSVEVATAAAPAESAPAARESDAVVANTRADASTASPAVDRLDIFQQLGLEVDADGPGHG